MRLNKLRRWFNRKAMARQLKTFANLSQGDFIWRITTKDRKVVARVYKLEKVAERKDNTTYWLNYDEFSSLTIVIRTKELEALRTSFILEPMGGEIFFSNQAVFEKYLNMVRMQANNKQTVDDLEKAIENSNKFLNDKLEELRGKKKEEA